MSIVARIIQDIFRSDGKERGARNLTLNLPFAKGGEIEVGPHPGHDDGSFALYLKQDGDNRVFFEFNPDDDDIAARMLGEALIAWADWAESEIEKRAAEADHDDCGARA